MQINSPSLKIMANPTESKDAIRYEDLFRDTGLLNDEILPVASQTSLGAIKAGNGISISEDGILDVTPAALPFIGGNSLGWVYSTSPPISTTVQCPNPAENHPTFEYARESLIDDDVINVFRRGYWVTGYIGETYTFSVSLYTEDNTSIDSSGILIQLKGAQSSTGDYTEDVIVKNITSENLPNNRWTTFSITLKIAEEEVQYVEAIISVVRNATFFIAQYQVQEGEIATGFYPAPPRLATSLASGLMSPSQFTELNKIVYTPKYSFIATDGNKLDPDDSNSTVDFVAGQNIALTVGYNDTLQADTITIDADVSDKADTTYVDELVGDINTELETKSTKPTILTDLTSTTQTVTLENNTEYRYGTLTSLAITWTTSDIHCSMAFTGGTDAEFSITEGVEIVGTDVTDGVFAPVEDKRYNLGFEFDGVNRTMYVYGVPDSKEPSGGMVIVSVTELPADPEPNTWYAIREVT